MVALATVAGGAAGDSIGNRRCYVPLRQHAQDSRRRVGAASVRHQHGAAHHHLAKGHGPLGPQDPAHGSATRRAPAQPREKAPADCAGYGGILDQHPRPGSHRAPSQSQAQQDLARTKHHSHSSYCGSAARVDDDKRITITAISPRFSHVTLKFGYMETPNVPHALAVARKQGLHFDIMSTSFFLSRRALKPAKHSGMPRWQDR